MVAKEIHNYMTYIQTVISFLNLVVTAILTYMIHNWSKKSSSIEFTRSIRDAWVNIDSLVLQDNELLLIADSILDPSPVKETDEYKIKKRWLTLMILNTLASTFDGRQRGFIEEGEALKAFEALLKPIISDEDTFRLTQERGHSRAFSEYCKEMRDKLSSEKHDNPGAANQQPP